MKRMDQKAGDCSGNEQNQGKAMKGFHGSRL